MGGYNLTERSFPGLILFGMDSLDRQAYCGIWQTSKNNERFRQCHNDSSTFVSFYMKIWLVSTGIIVMLKILLLDPMFEIAKLAILMRLQT